MGLLALGIAGNASAEEDSAAFFANVRKSYAQRPSYSDLGQIEVTEEIEGIEDSRLHFFETATTRVAGRENSFVWRVRMASNLGFDESVVWLADEAVKVYDGGLWQVKTVRSIAEGIEDVLGPTVGQALLVPTLLETGVDSALDTLAAIATSATLGDPESCFGDRECRLLSAPLAGDGEVRLTVETGTFWIHDVELVVHQAAPADDAPRATSGAKTTTVRVSHSDAGSDVGFSEARVTFSPSITTREVTEWERAESQELEELDLETGFFDEITVDIFTKVVRIVSDSGHPLRDLGPRDLIATIGYHELPITAVDWYRASPELFDEVESAGPAMETTKIESRGRLIVIFLQNDFVHTRMKGQMKLFPGLSRLVDNLAPADRVAVLSYFADLKLWQDFTSDREAIKASLEQAFYPGASPNKVEASPGISLLAHFDQDAARNVINSVEALHLAAHALSRLPGEKEIIFFGYGIEGDRAVPMLKALQAAHAVMFVVDTTQAERHRLRDRLEEVAVATGGTYAPSYGNTSAALDKIERTIAGHYVITIDRSATPDVRGRLVVRLRDKKGKVLIVPSKLL